MTTESTKKAWSEEYQRKGIPSSFRKDSTKTVRAFIAWWREQGRGAGGIAADIGCGQGRNSVYLAAQGFQVIGMDLLEENVSLVNAQAQANGWPIQAFAQDVASKWPIASETLEIAIDVFCYKHIVTKERQAQYRQELWKALKPKGFYFISLASEEDGFYGPLLRNSPIPEEKLIVDPHSQISSFLYSAEDLEREFLDAFEVVEMIEQTSTSPMHGKEYRRVVLNAVFKKC